MLAASPVSKKTWEILCANAVKRNMLRSFGLCHSRRHMQPP